MKIICIKLLIGFIIGLVFSFSVVTEQTTNFCNVFFYIAWSTGIVFGFRAGMHLLHSIIDSSFKISIISFVSIGSGIIGLIILVAVVVAMLAVGWLYGYYVLYKELKSIK